jgi:uncharacterized protein (TIGR03437 family)
LSKLLFVLAISTASLAADFAPALQWVHTAASSGTTFVNATAADTKGNLYIAGATNSLDFPTTTAIQPSAGGSVLARIDLASGNTSRLYPANLAAIGFTAAVPSSPGTLLAASGSQVWKSADAGGTWTMLSKFSSTTTVSYLAADPTNSNTVYAATTTLGLNKSVDGGLTWTAINNGLPLLQNGGLSGGGIWVDPTAPATLIASGSFGLARSADAGNSWSILGGGIFVRILVFDPLTAGTLYAVDSNVITKSSDHGQTFIRLSALPNQAQVLALAADPQHPGVLYAGGSGGIYQSSDGGKTWSLKLAGVTTLLAADPASAAFYFNLTGYGIVKSTDGFVSSSPVGPSEPAVLQLVVSGGNLFEVSAASTDAFLMKLDNDGNVVYSTYFGGSGSDGATALAAGPDGSLYVAGNTTSADLPVTAGAYLTKLPTSHGTSASFLLKLNPDGSRAWATYFTEIAIASIAVDSAGNPYVGGATGGGLPTTPGVYQTTFQQNISSNGFFGVIGPTSAFVTKFNAAGTGLVYSTYVPHDNQKNTVSMAQALVVDAAGNAWIGVPFGSGFVPTGISPSVVKLNSNGSAVLASAVQAASGSVAALALDADSNVYVAGSYSTASVAFPATPGAFQPAPLPAIPPPFNQSPAGGGQDAFVAKWDSDLTHLLAATLLGGEQGDSASSVAVDASGTVIVSGSTSSKSFPLHAPFQTSFSSPSGFVAALDSNLSNLLFSTYLGDGRQFLARGAFPDGNGNILLAGYTVATPNVFPSLGNVVVANKIALQPAPAVRLDGVQNYASHLGGPLAPGEAVMVLGAGFGNSAQIVVDGSPLDTVSATATSIVAVLPDTLSTTGVHTVQVSNSGALSNFVYAPAAPSAPGIYSVDGSGTGQGYILNSDGTLNSPSNPAAPGSAFTLFATGEGQYSLTNGYAVTAQTPAVFINGFFCPGIAAIAGPVSGLPGNLYQLSMFVPDLATLAANNPDLKNFKFPPQSLVRLAMGNPNSPDYQNSQGGIYINIK